METQEIRIEENGLKVIFEVRENGIVELKQFTTAGKPDLNLIPQKFPKKTLKKKMGKRLNADSETKFLGNSNEWGST